MTMTKKKGCCVYLETHSSVANSPPIKFKMKGKKGNPKEKKTMKMMMIMRLLN
jgi:hypothetical protein